MSEILNAIVGCNDLIERSKQIMRDRAAAPPLPDDDLERIGATLDSPTCWKLNFEDARKLLAEVRRVRAILNPI